MNTLIRTTITIPGELFAQLKLTSALQGKSFSAFVSENLRQLITTPSVARAKVPADVLGKLNFDMTKLPSRQAIHEQYLQQKLGH